MDLLALFIFGSAALSLIVGALLIRAVFRLPDGEGNYRSQWYLSDRRGSLFMAAGIHGQWLYGDRDRGVSIVKLASHPGASAAEPAMDDLACFAAIAERLAG